MANPIDSERKRRDLKPRPRPYFYIIKPLQRIAYRRNKLFSAGKWIAILDKAQQPMGSETELNYAEALDDALKWFAANTDTVTVAATVEIAIQDYVAHLKIQKSEGTSTATDNRLRKHVSTSLLNTKLAALTTRQVKVFQSSMISKSNDPEAIRKSKDSANRVMNMFKAALNLAYRDGQVATDAAWRRVSNYRSVSIPRKLFLTKTQVNSLLGACSGGLHNLIKVAVLTGARYGELSALTVSDFDPANGTLQLTGKTGTHITYLSDDAVAVIKEITKDKLPAAYLLVQGGGNQWRKNSHSREMKAAIKKAKLPAETVFYNLRHYHISMALLAGVNAQVIAENCGTSTKMIEKHYGKFMKADRRAMFNTVNLGVVS